MDSAIVCFVPIFLQFLKFSFVSPTLKKFSEDFDLDLGLKKGVASDYLVLKLKSETGILKGLGRSNVFAKTISKVRGNICRNLFNKP